VVPDSDEMRNVRKPRRSRSGFGFSQSKYARQCSAHDHLLRAGGYIAGPKQRRCDVEDRSTPCVAGEVPPRTALVCSSPEISVGSLDQPEGECPVGIVEACEGGKGLRGRGNHCCGTE
jgi:hypothetical protein